ncbi:VWA domain-containing protein [Skermania sp. ID1734]|uniref:VWA domain-containing protein n=1 Tax=Skermania sp. ID1734 TaxID=2597516 RepID=UPI00117D508A|nr:VWA domain-containing protein [Skermania sp. ID1734]TSD97376.1 VWA domain-containing protein [Skermania sp. ID1734]
MSMSGFTSPWWLAFIAVAVALGIAYVLVQRRRHRHVLRFTNMELLEKVAPTRPSRARHIPTVLALLGVILLAIGLAGPTADKRIPRNRATVMLVIDVSLSMKATDVKPSRIAAAQEAAKQFVDSLTPGINLGLVAFAGTASVLVSPTTNRAETKAAIDHLQLSERTATGEGIFTALQAIDTLAGVIGGAEEPPPARIVMESDGKQTVPESLDDPRGGFTAARAAKAKGVPVSTISFGTSWGTVDIPNPDGGSERVPVPVDDPSLKEIAQLSGGSFFTASSLDDLHKAYSSLQEQIGFQTVRGDASRPWVILGTLLITAAFATSLALRQRIP